MPRSLKDSASSLLLSAAATEEKLFLVEKQTGLTHWFDPEVNSWSDGIALNPSQPIQSCHVSYSSSAGLILVGICPIEDGETIKMWRIGENDFSIEEIGEMSEYFVAGLKSDSEDFSIDVRLAENFVLVYNSLQRRSWDRRVGESHDDEELAIRGGLSELTRPSSDESFDFCCPRG
ncbi:hypothetical protein SASPL_142645 [Salvia splendens]|uniref:Uncharacterized protein n=1 Tax=Salvia splendens TaxID=180675 RepID=A0A8X8ZA08_SALSN|nr:hypothetical protein SASPL_142645 [Salvia splendens]